MTASVLTCLGLEDLIAETLEEYPRLAAALASNGARRAELRRSLRERMLASPLCGGTAFTRGLESVYRQMWGLWCERRHGREGQAGQASSAPLNR
jgi:protein O-GlcNAc transferase